MSLQPLSGCLLACWPVPGRSTLSLGENYARVAAFILAWSRAISDADRSMKFSAAASACHLALKFRSSIQPISAFWQSYQAAENIEQQALDAGHSLAFRLCERWLEWLGSTLPWILWGHDLVIIYPAKACALPARRHGHRGEWPINLVGFECLCTLLRQAFLVSKYMLSFPWTLCFGVCRQVQSCADSSGQSMWSRGHVPRIAGGLEEQGRDLLFFGGRKPFCEYVRSCLFPLAIHINDIRWLWWQTDKRAGFPFKEDHGSANMFIVGEVAKHMLYMWQWLLVHESLKCFILVCGDFPHSIFLNVDWENWDVETDSHFRAACIYPGFWVRTTFVDSNNLQNIFRDCEISWILVLPPPFPLFMHVFHVLHTYKIFYTHSYISQATPVLSDHTYTAYAGSYSWDG